MYTYASISWGDRGKMPGNFVSIRPRPYVSWYFLIHNLFFQDTPCIHANPANSLANPELFQYTLQSGYFLIQYESGTMWMPNPDIYLFIYLFIYLTLPVKLTEHHNSLRQLLWPLSHPPNHDTQKKTDHNTGNYVPISRWRNKIEPSSLPWKSILKMAAEGFMAHAMSPPFEESWALEWIQIRFGYVWMGKFDLNTLRVDGNIF